MICCEGKELVGPYKSNGFIVYICEGCGARTKTPMPAKTVSMPKKVVSHGLQRKEDLAANSYVRED